MADTARAQRFADALQTIEGSGDVSALVEMFASGAELSRPELEKAHGPTTDAEEFWTAYLAQFSEIRTEFTHVDEQGDLAVLEWGSTGKLKTGRDIDYRGVSVLSLDGDSVARFSTFYDTAAFVVPEA